MGLRQPISVTVLRNLTSSALARIAVAHYFIRLVPREHDAAKVIDWLIDDLDQYHVGNLLFHPSGAILMYTHDPRENEDNQTILEIMMLGGEPTPFPDRHEWQGTEEPGCVLEKRNGFDGKVEVVFTDLRAPRP